MEQCRNRYKEMAERALSERRLKPLFDVEFIVADCSRVSFPILKNLFL
jgi:hypothetical protein